ncbi:contractile injection system protein, VgrG/Pvc8 family [Variovorax boronicumulans]
MSNHGSVPLRMRSSSPSADRSALWAELSQTARLYRLEAPSASSSSNSAARESIDALRVEGWVQREAVSQLFELRIVCLSLRADLALSSLIDQPLTLVTVLADGSVGRRTGLIRAVESLGADGAWPATASRSCPGSGWPPSRGAARSSSSAASRTSSNACSPRTPKPAAGPSPPR